MSSQCNHFVQNAWKKELCSNCFKSREEHSEVTDNNVRINSARVTTMTTKTRNLEAKPQSILKGKTSSRGKKKVTFPDTLAEVIGYNGGDDLSDSEEFELNESLNVEDELPDSEEERALSELTRANTNFNTVTANSSSNSVTDSKKSFASLMLGKPRKDSDGKKKTLLVTVTPFGAGTNIPSAKRPNERKTTTTTFSNFTNLSKSNSGEVVAETKSDVCTLKSVNNITEDKILRDRSEKESHDEQGSTLEKIVDMPLITSSNLISVIQKSDSLTIETTTSTRIPEGYEKSGESLKGSSKTGVERRIGITRTPAIKKQKDVEKPKILSLQGNYKQTLNTKNEYIARTNSRENESYNRIDENDIKPEINGPQSIVQEKNIENRERTWSNMRGKDVNTIEVQAALVSASIKDVRGDSDPTFSSQVSRELAGEPDGKADEEMVEPPALPRSPPPVEARMSSSEPRNSFLHNVEKKSKPAVPQKPTSLPPKGPVTGVRSVPTSVISATARTSRKEAQEETIAAVPNSPKFKAPAGNGRMKNGDDEEEDDETINLPADAETELVRSPNKRRMAPKPPPPTYAGIDEVGGSLFARNPGGVNMKSDSPVVREKEKRERASSCSPKFRKDADIDGSETVEPPVPSSSVPEPAPRRLISLSQDSLANADKIEEKKKVRSRFSLKKFLRMGSKKDHVDGHLSIGSRLDDLPTSPQPASKPRLEIIHPLELDGAAVEVVSREKAAGINDDAKHDAIEIQEQHSDALPLLTGSSHHPFARPGKPPPPPRNQSLDDWARLDPANKPARPPPPRAEIKSPTKSWHPPSPSSPDSIYANLAAEDVPGEVRSSLTPSKPQRTASMRDQGMNHPQVKKRPAGLIPRHQDYEIVGSARPGKTDSPNMSTDSHAYECLSSSPECDSSLDLRHGATGRDHAVFQANGKRKSDSSALHPGTEFKYGQQPFIRSTSLPYCGSETESELYSPYSFYTGDEGPEEDQDWKTSKEQESRVGRLRQRRGRSIVHRSLEDNYGAVIIANHEALAQVLEQLNQNTGIPPALRDLKTANLCLSDFNLDKDSSLALGRRIFYNAVWNDTAVTICIALDLALHVSRKEFNLVPITEFTDATPDFVVDKMNCGEKKNVQATISVLPRLQVTTINSFAENLKESNDEGFVRETSFVLLQLVNAFKNLQARGVEEAPKNLNNAVLCRDSKDACYRLYLLQSLTSNASEEREQERGSLCQCVLQALKDLKLSQRLPLVQELLERERTASLSQVKSVLEFSLWGPADVPLGGSRDREMTLQRWLDLERATVLHALVRARAPLAVTDEYHLLFLVRTSAKIMCEASMLLDAQRRK